MNTIARTRRTRRTLATVAWSRALLLALGAALAVYVIGGLIESAMRAALALGVALAVLVLLRARLGRVDLLRAALWMEERAPSGYARVALVEDAANGGRLLAPDQREGLQRALASNENPAIVSTALRHTARSQLLGPSLFVAVAIGAVALGSWSAARAVQLAKNARVSATVPTRAVALAPMGAWRVRVMPPAYSGLPVQNAGDAGAVRALAGSRIDVDGAGPSPEVKVRGLGENSARLQRVDSTPPVLVADNRWRTRITVGGAPLEVRAMRGGVARQLLVEAYSDSIPQVSLRSPARDSVLRAATGVLPLRAVLHDDLGLSTASFELIISSGEGERFTARTVSMGARRFQSVRDATLQLSLDLDALKLGPGDVFHLRAIARDAYPLAGREAGSSETRSFRVARQSEYDSIAVEPAPPPAVDSSLLSQRMLLMLAERLEKRRASIDRVTLVGESRKLARDQARLRQSVGDVVFQRLSGEQGAEHSHSAGDGHDHGVDLVDGKLAASGKDANGMLEEGDDSPIININRPLLEAYNAMWDAGRALELGAPRDAIPFMRVALAAIERARSASRLYLRGRPPTVIVDVAKVRQAGKDTGATNLRTDRAALPQRERARERRLLAATELFSTSASAARDSLALLRLDALGDAPLFADALAAALDAIGKGQDVTPALIRARRALDSVVRLPVGAWSRAGTP